MYNLQGLGGRGDQGSRVRGKGSDPHTRHTVRNSTPLSSVGTRASKHFATQTLSGPLGLQGRVQEDLFTQRTRLETD